MSFPARYRGRCTNCTFPILEGDLIEMSDDGAHHEGCTVDIHPTPPVEHPVCTTCFLTHPPGTCGE